MNIFFRSNWQIYLLQKMSISKSKHSLCSSPFKDHPVDLSTEFQELCCVISSSVGGLDDLEKSLNKFSGSLSSSLFTQVIDSCKNEAPARSLLRFFSWSRKNSVCSLEDKEFNYLIRVLAEKKDHTAMQILISDLRKENRAMDPLTFSIVAETLVKLGREDEALGIFKNLYKFKCPQDNVTLTAIVNALCSKGHVKRAIGVLYHHKDKISGNELCVYRSLLYGCSVQENVKEARKVLKEMKLAGITPDLFCYNTMLSCLCKRNLKRNPSGLVPEALNVMMEMRSHRIPPNSISYNILLSCLGRTRRVRESCRIMELMKKSGCDPDGTSYFLVTRVLYLTGRFGKGNKMVDEMIERGVRPDCKFYYDLIGILCGLEKVNLAVELFEKMKTSLSGGYGPVYDVLIPKLCKGGDFEKGRELWSEAESLGVTLRCSSDLLDPSITQVFKPTKERQEAEIVDCSAGKSRLHVRMKKKVKLKHKAKKKIRRSN